MNFLDDLNNSPRSAFFIQPVPRGLIAAGLVWKYIKFTKESFILMENKPTALPHYWHSNVLLLLLLLLYVCVCARARACVCVCEDRHPWLTCLDQEVQSGQAHAGVEEDEVVKIMKQKILNNLFSLSTVALHMAYTFQFKLQDNRGKWIC